MQPFSASAKSERLRHGAVQRVLLVVDPPALLERMSEVVRSMPGLQFAAGFSTTEEAIEWTVWDREGWHFAFVDVALKDGGTSDLVARLLAQPRPGTVVALGAHLWKETREACRQIGIHHLLEKGDLIAFRGFLEEQLR